MLRELARKIDRAQDVFGRGLAWLVLLMVLVVFGDVVMRYAIQRTYVFTQELEWYLFAITYLLGGGYVMLWDEHVRVDIFYSRLSPRAKAWSDFVLLFVFFYPSCFLVMYTTWPFFRNSLAVWEGSPDPGGIPARWALKSVIIIAFAVMAIQGFSEAVKRSYSRRVLGNRSEPEPDVCVVRGAPRDFVESHPRRPALLVEVAQSGLRIARGRKAAAYARARIADYWIVNLVDRVLEVRREPARPGPARRHWGYAAIETLGADATIAPLAAQSAAIRVADFLP